MPKHKCRTAEASWFFRAQVFGLPCRNVHERFGYVWIITTIHWLSSNWLLQPFPKEPDLSGLAREPKASPLGRAAVSPSQAQDCHRLQGQRRYLYRAGLPQLSGSGPEKSGVGVSVEPFSLNGPNQVPNSVQDIFSGGLLF